MLISACGALYAVLTSHIVFNIRSEGRKKTGLHTYAGSDYTGMLFSTMRIDDHILDELQTATVFESQPPY